MQRLLTLLLIISLAASLSACDNDKAKNTKQAVQPQIITAQMKPSTSTLYFSGTISPLRITPVVSPIKGTVEKMYFNYGQKIVVGDKLAQVQSSDLQKNFRTALTDFLKAKDDLDTKKTNYNGQRQLWNLGFIAKKDYDSAKSDYENAQITLVQKRDALEKQMRQLKIKLNVKTLSLSDTTTINQLLSNSYDKLTIDSPTAGVALLPSKEGSGDSGSGTALQIGTQLKEGQMIVGIGDLGGLTLVVSVNEVNIDEIKPGQKITVTGPAFPQISLHGTVTSVGNQAKSSGGGLPTFPIKVTVPNLTAKEIQKIRVGMSAKIKLDIQHGSKLSIPITAVYQDNGKDMVKIIDPKTGQPTPVAVQTGQTSLDAVEILSGIKSGDNVVVPN